MKIPFTKTDLMVNTFFKKSLPPLDDSFGVYFITGRQGSGKNYYAVQMILKQDLKRVNKIYTNVKSLNIPGIDIIYFDKIQEIYTNIDENCIFLIDEIARKYDRLSKTDTQLYAFLNQSRKRKRIVLMITQEWREIPMWLRRPAKFMLATRPVPFLNQLGFFITTVGDAENMIFDKDEGEYLCPPIRNIVYKRNTYIASLYDTFEAINTL